MVLVGQAAEILQDGDSVVIATTNVKHIKLFMDARKWSDISAEDLV